ncbi:RNA polymerase sigma-70 factor (ECF subfamily) [Hyphomicrobiales bacterium]|nr:RNA polymerase sigma-70 factor (ECF subfamily) [Hyphomicrobiales bacterium]CAH1684286.1 RNA polymerase sigma-70 factor (ECF subfamily) [Hyphomicrobiales bacterium]
MSDRGPDQDAMLTEAFSAARPRLIRLAYRMLGSIAEAEDMVQEAFIRLHRADAATIREPAAFLSRVVTNLCLDQLKSARVKRESYVGPWLPEPVVDPLEDEGTDDITTALMVALERLSPLERAAFLLHDVFGVGFDEIAASLQRDPAACRQLARRARAHVQAARPRFPVSPEKGRDLAEAFLAASATGNMAGLQALLAEDVVLYGDGGGKVAATFNPIFGQDKVSRFFWGLSRKKDYKPATVLRRCVIDGLPGFVTVDGHGHLQTTALAIDNGRITAIYVVRNPDKLAHVVEGLSPFAS